jgi:hypothetical protein
VFTPEERDALRAELLARARSDPRISGGALTGSASVAAEDRWSDIDLAFGVREAAQLREVLEDFTSYMRDARGALEHLDVLRDPWIYRVFLMPSTLQVDLAFAPAAHFRARARTFRLDFGQAAEASHIADPDPRELIGYGWLYALHGRSSIARGRRWQAEYMIGLMRDQVLSLACVRLGLPAREARGTDRLPADVTRPLEAALIGGLQRAELLRAFGAATEGLIGEITKVDEALATRLTPTLVALAESVGRSVPDR